MQPERELAMKKKATKSERDHMSRVSSIGCLICRRPAAIHHARMPFTSGKRRNNMKVIPLCPSHHQHDAISAHGMHHDKFFELYGSESDMLDKVEKILENRND